MFGKAATVSTLAVFAGASPARHWVLSGRILSPLPLLDALLFELVLVELVLVELELAEEALVDEDELEVEVEELEVDELLELLELLELDELLLLFPEEPPPQADKNNVNTSEKSSVARCLLDLMAARPQ